MFSNDIIAKYVSLAKCAHFQSDISNMLYLQAKYTSHKIPVKDKRCAVNCIPDRILFGKYVVAKQNSGAVGFHQIASFKN